MKGDEVVFFVRYHRDAEEVVFPLDDASLTRDSFWLLRNRPRRPGTGCAFRDCSLGENRSARLTRAATYNGTFGDRVAEPCWLDPQRPSRVFLATSSPAGDVALVAGASLAGMLLPFVVVHLYRIYFFRWRRDRPRSLRPQRELYFPPGWLPPGAKGDVE